MAKDVALFSAVLQDLGNAPKEGFKSRIYRKEAYQNSETLVKECKVLCGDIEDVLKKCSKSESVDSGDAVSRRAKVLWAFRKPKVELLRGNLESLKSTVAVQLAVLNYTSQVEQAGTRSVSTLIAYKSKRSSLR